MRHLFRKQPKTFTGVRVTHRAIEIVRDDRVVQFIAKDEIQIIRVGHDNTSRMMAGYAIYLHTNEVEGLLVTSDMKGCRHVEDYMLNLPGVNKNNIIAIMETGTAELIDVWRRGDDNVDE